MSPEAARRRCVPTTAKNFTHRLTLLKGKFTGLKESLGLCSSPNSTAQGQYILFNIFYSFSNVAQFGFNYPQLYGKRMGGIEYVVTEALKIPDNDPLAVLKIANDLSSASAGLKCVDWVPSRVLDKALGLPFEWIVSNWI